MPSTFALRPPGKSVQTVTVNFWLNQRSKATTVTFSYPLCF